MHVKSPLERRVGKRITLSFHVEVSGIGRDGIPYWDQAVASDVSGRGCQIHLTRKVETGDTLTLRVVRQKGPAVDQEAPFRYQIAWVTANNGFWAAGLEALEPGNPWHMTFPQESLVRR
jgi:PilZ domain